MEDRIYRSLRAAHERHSQGHATPDHPVAASAEGASAPAPEPAAPAAGHALSAHVGSSPVAAPTHVVAGPSEAWGARWFARSASADRPRISLVGTLSLAVLISAGLFAVQAIVKPRQNADKSVAASAQDNMHLVASHSSDEADDADGSVSVPSRFHHVHAPASHAHGHKHSAHAVDEESSSADADSETADASTPAVKAHRSGSASGAVQHAADEAEAAQPSDAALQTPAGEQPNESLDISAPPAAPVSNHSSSNHGALNHVVPAVQVPAPQAPAQTPLAAQAYPAMQAAPQPVAQPVAATAPQATGSPWAVAPSGQPGATAVQVAAEAPTAPSLTILPGHSTAYSPPAAAPAAAAQPPVQQQPVEPPAARQSPSGNVYPVYQDHPQPAAPAQPTSGPFEALDRTKVMSFQFRNAPWTLVLAKFANATGLELRMQALPEGTFNRWDAARYTPSQTLAILNTELAKTGCQAKVVGGALCVVSASGDGATQASATLPAAPPAPPAAAPSAMQQLPQYPGTPASPGAAYGAGR